MPSGVLPVASPNTQVGLTAHQRSDEPRSGAAHARYILLDDDSHTGIFMLADRENRRAEQSAAVTFAAGIF